MDDGFRDRILIGLGDKEVELSGLGNGMVGVNGFFFLIEVIVSGKQNVPKEKRNEIIPV